MDRIRFACSACSATLAANADFVGKTITCPKCKEKTVIEPLVETKPSEPPLRFPCTKCGTKLKVIAQFAGRAIPCPKCGQNTLVPDADEAEGGSYGFAASSHSQDDDVPAHPEPDIDEWWPDGEKLNLPPSWRIALSRARTHIEEERWTKALGLLNELFQKEVSGKGKIGTHFLRKPLAFCLVRWAAREIDRMDDARAKPSTPLRKVLKKAMDMQRYAGTLSSSECQYCGRELHHLVGTTQVRTIAGSAYLCCARPTPQDHQLVHRVDSIGKKLKLGGSLDPDNRQIPKAMKMLPDWYRALDIYESNWTKVVVDNDSQGDGRGGSTAGDVAGYAAARVLSSLLFG